MELNSGFAKVERDFVVNNVNRTTNAMNDLVKNLYTKQSDWAAWDDTYEFVGDQNPDYIKSNLTNESLQTLGVELMLFLDKQNKLVYSKMIDGELGQTQTIPQDLLQLAEPNSKMLNLPELNSQAGGFLLTDSGEPFLAVSQPILTSERQGPANGVLIWGYHITPKIIDGIAQSLKLNVHLANIPATSQTTNNKTLWQDNVLIQKTGPDAISGATSIQDIYGTPQFQISIDTNRPIHRQGQKVIRSIVLLLLLVVFVLALFIYIFINKLVVLPLTRLASGFNKVTQAADPIYRLDVVGNDEFADLSKIANNTLAALHDREAKLQDVQYQLYNSQKIQAIGKLAGGIAHDFNNLLTSILGFSSLLKERFKDDPKATRQLEMIIKSAENGAELVKNLLGFARQGRYERKQISINTIIANTKKLLQPSMAHIQMQFDHPPDLAPIEGDENQLQHVFMNLMINARDAMPNGGKITLTAKSIEIQPEEALKTSLKPQKYVRVTISDTGTGIPEKIKNDIFEPFFTTKAQGKGFGLGLSMVSGIMANHGGGVFLDPATVGGAIFHLYFPVADNKAKHPNHVSQTSTHQNPIDLNTTLHGKNILVVDDEKAIRTWIKAVLEQHGPMITTADNGQEAINIMNKIPETKFDAVILDVIMPIKNGIETFHEIRAKTNTLPIIFSTGYAENESLTKLLDGKNTRLLLKPFSKNVLLETLIDATAKQPLTQLTTHHL